MGPLPLTTIIVKFHKHLKLPYMFKYYFCYSSDIQSTPSTTGPTVKPPANIRKIDRILSDWGIVLIVLAVLLVSGAGIIIHTVYNSLVYALIHLCKKALIKLPLQGYEICGGRTVILSETI